MATLSELYKMGNVKEDQLGVLAKAVICAKLGCADGQEVVFGNHTFRLIDSLPPRRPEQRLKHVDEGVQQTRPTATARNTVNVAPKTPASRQDVHTQVAKRNPPTLQPMQKPAAGPAMGQTSKDMGLAKTGKQRPGNVGQKATLPLFPSEEKTQPRQSAQSTTPQKSSAERGAALSYRQELKQRHEAGPSTTTQKLTTPNEPTSDVKQEAQTGIIDQSRLDGLAELVAKEAKANVAMARLVLSSILNYLSAYPSVGILRIVDDIARKTKADPRLIRAAIDALRSIDVVEIVDDAVVNLKKR